jgi:hypothetical protein
MSANTAPPRLAALLDQCRMQLRSISKTFGHEEYGLNELLNINTEYDRKIFAMALLLFQSQITDTIEQLKCVKDLANDALYQCKDHETL